MATAVKKKATKKAPVRKAEPARKAAAGKKPKAKKDVSASYEKYKVYDGKQYTGMAIGRSHKWYYDKGEWREKKVTPERWELNYAVVKRRAGKAPEGSGVPVGTGYHWFILSHQFVEKLNADDYTTNMVGLKFKLAHRRADKGKWSSSDASQRKHLVQILRGLADELERVPEKTTPVQIAFDYRGKHYEGEGIPVISSCHDGACFELDITLNKKHMGIIRCTKSGWKMTGIKTQGLVNAIGAEVHAWYE
jgi:hypothetical protein